MSNQVDIEALAKRQCCRIVARGPQWQNLPCRIPATVEHRGNWYCHVHAPGSKHKAFGRQRPSRMRPAGGEVEGG